MNTEQINAMGKTELRAAMKAAGLSYSKLNNDGMRAALVAHYSEPTDTDGDQTERVQEVDTGGELDAGASMGGTYEADIEKSAAKDPVWDAAVEAARAIVAAPGFDLSKLGESGVMVQVDEGQCATEQGFCPHCFCHESNGFCDSQHIADGSDKEAKKHAREMKSMYTCLGCGGEWGPANPLAKKPAAAPTGKGIKIEKDRPTQNGVTRPSAGGACADVWDALDAIREEGGTPTAKDVRSLAEHEKWNLNNALIEFYQWRKFNGITGRQAAKK